MKVEYRGFMGHFQTRLMDMPFSFGWTFCSDIQRRVVPSTVLCKLD